MSTIPTGTTEREAERARLMRALRNLEEKSLELHLDRVKLHEASPTVSKEAKRFFKVRDRLFLKARKALDQMSYNDFVRFEEECRYISIGLRKIQNAVKGGGVIEEGDFNFYAGLRDMVRARLPWWETSWSWVKENIDTLKTIVAVLGLVGTIGGGIWVALKYVLDIGVEKTP